MDALGITYLCGVSIVGICTTKVLYSLIRGTRNKLAFQLLALTIVWMLCWGLRADSSLSVTFYFTWAIHVQGWLFANRYLYSYLIS